MFVKPTLEEVDELAVDLRKNGDFVTAYSVTNIVNEWLVADGYAPISPQRVYNQFAKKVNKTEKRGSRFTELGAQQLAKIAYSHIVKNTQPVKKADS